MGHIIQACIGDAAIINEVRRLLNDSQITVEELPQQYFLLYVTDSLYKVTYKDSDLENEVEPFEYLNGSLKSFFEKVSLAGDLVYIETEYFGGVGSQAAGLFHDGNLNAVCFSDGSGIDINIPYPERLLDEPINQSLRAIGVKRKQNNDEFDTLNLSNYRHMPYNNT